MAAYGGVDEVNALLGLLLAEPAAELDEPTRALVRGLQNDLFDVGADLCLPQKTDEKAGQVLRVRAEQVQRLEQAIDERTERLEPLHSFILPGGTRAAAWCHLARTVCRRAERDVATLARAEAINPQVLIYLNRLSDLLFVLARTLNRHGQDDVLWQPGKNQE